ncbi:hypothetical protein JXA12_03405 [Candidatus Woesearchaeota archaeon]|nr:hypothetical protein [Candidatus Woesearchaeota archaeon]
MVLDRKATIELKTSLLAQGIDFEIDLFTKIKEPFYDNQFVYGKTSRNVTQKNKFPQVLELGHNIISALLRREGSPWNLKYDDDVIQLYNNNTFIQEITLPERPAYFDKKLSDGTPTESIIAVAGSDTPGFFLYPECFYFPEGKACGFCSMKNTRSTVGKYMVSEFSEDNIREATNIFEKTLWRDIPLISITAGTPENDQITREKVIKPLTWMYESLEDKIPTHLLAHPPNDFKLLEEYKEAGVTSIAFNIEVYNRQKFKEICPGKHALYGYDKWVDALDAAKDVFGNFNVYCGLVWGLEHPQSSIEGHEYFLQKGIGIASNIFHADPISVLSKHPQPSEEQILEIAYAESKLFQEHPYVNTIFPVSMRSTIDWEVHRGDLT